MFSHEEMSGQVKTSAPSLRVQLSVGRVHVRKESLAPCGMYVLNVQRLGAGYLSKTRYFMYEHVAESMTFTTPRTGAVVGHGTCHWLP